jgi:hypothetical protein
MISNYTMTYIEDIQLPIYINCKPVVSKFIILACVFFFATFASEPETARN